MTERLWKIQEQTTNGWTSIDPKTDNLTKEQCDKWLVIIWRWYTTR